MLAVESFDPRLLWDFAGETNTREAYPIEASPVEVNNA
jgi:hypothetical protein